MASYNNLKEEKTPVLFELQFKPYDQDLPSYFRLDSDKYTLYPNEDDVLLCDGEPFTVVSVDSNH